VTNCNDIDAVWEKIGEGERKKFLNPYRGYLKLSHGYSTTTTTTNLYVKY